MKLIHPPSSRRNSIGSSVPVAAESLPVVLPRRATSPRTADEGPPCCRRARSVWILARTPAIKSGKLEGGRPFLHQNWTK